MIFLSISCVSENVNDFKRNQQLTVSVSKDIKLRCYKDDSSDVYFTIFNSKMNGFYFERIRTSKKYEVRKRIYKNDSLLFEKEYFYNNRGGLDSSLFYTVSQTDSLILKTVFFRSNGNLSPWMAIKVPVITKSDTSYLIFSMKNIYQSELYQNISPFNSRIPSKEVVKFNIDSSNRRLGIINDSGLVFNKLHMGIYTKKDILFNYKDFILEIPIIKVNQESNIVKEEDTYYFIF